MTTENVYIAFLLNSANVGTFSSYNDVINLFNSNYPNNKLVIEKYLVNGSSEQTSLALDNFIMKYPFGKRVAVSISSTILIGCSDYFVKNKLDILSLSLSASSNNIKKKPNVLTYGYYNQYAVMTNFMIYQDYQMDRIHVLYELNTTNDVFFKDSLELIEYQAKLLNIPVVVSFFEKGKSDYNIQPKSMVIMLGITKDITDIYVTPQFLDSFPPESFILLTGFNRDMKDIFGNVPAIVQLFTNIEFSPLSKSVYDAVKNNPNGYDFTVYPFYDVLFVLNDFTTNRLPLTNINYTIVNPYKSNLAAWIVNTDLESALNGSPYGKYQYTFTKNIIIGADQNLFLKYYGGGGQILPDSYSIFRIAGLTPFNPSLIEYDESYYYKIYGKNCQLVAVKFNSDITNFPAGKNLNIGKTNLTKFIYKYNSERYFIKLLRLFQRDGKTPQVNQTMSKITQRIKYII